MEREVICEMPDTTEYRVVCRYGYSFYVNNAWWGHLQKKSYYRKYLFFGRRTWRWVEIDRCWWSKEMKSLKQLQDTACGFYDKRILLRKRLDEQAMKL